MQCKKGAKTSAYQYKGAGQAQFMACRDADS